MTHTFGDEHTFRERHALGLFVGALTVTAVALVFTLYGQLGEALSAGLAAAVR